MAKIVVFGGGGYCGGVVVPDLLADGWIVTVFDKFWYGSQHLKDHPNLSLIEGDVRDLTAVKEALQGQEYVLHLACISNDASFELDENLSTSVNLDSFEPLVLAAKTAGVRRFVFASSSSVYGVSDEPDVKEDHPLIPITLYNKYKGMCEPRLLEQVGDAFTGVVFRPATVCGYSPRQRLDLSVNILTNHAINKGEISVFGGEQLRPNLHIQDYSDLCRHLLTAPENLVNGEIFNCGYENLRIIDIANQVKEVVERNFDYLNDIKIRVLPSEDPRSYHINSEKIRTKLGFVPQYSITDAVVDLCSAFKHQKFEDPLNNEKYFNVKLMKRIKAR